MLIPEIASLIEEGIKVKFNPTGSSMHPFINGNMDSVVLVPPEDIRKGDAVLAKTGDIYVLHRITRLNGDEITLMGDGNICGMEKCKRADIIALVAEIVREKALMYLQDEIPHGIAVDIAVIKITNNARKIGVRSVNEYINSVILPSSSVIPIFK